MLSALGNVWKIPELRQKITFTLIMFAIFRMGTHIPVPGVDPTAIEQLFANGNLFGLLDLFSGGAFSKFSIFAMSITPYIQCFNRLKQLKKIGHPIDKVELIIMGGTFPSRDLSYQEWFNK